MILANKCAGTPAVEEEKKPAALANPTPVGLFGLFITTLAFSAVELGLGGATQLNGILYAEQIPG
jgi:succinate-acetate transporter protein